jgi:gliding motility-associated lipoprotein GldH
LRYIVHIVVGCLLLSSCIKTDLYEKNLAIPGHAWEYGFKPGVEFTITDTTSSYNIFIVVRHTDEYGYNNLWVRLKSSSPGDTAVTTQQFDLPLASQNRWTGTGMDDIYEHRILLYKRPIRFVRTGNFRVHIEQVMRENPLPHIMNIGLRLEKVPER